MKYPALTELYQLYLQHPVVCTDTRNIIPGSLYFALKGPNFNANSFANEALQKGAVYAIIDDEKEYAEGCILVKDVLKTLQELAVMHRDSFNIPVIAITGTNGKTTTKELISTVLAVKYKVLSTKGNLNNHIGVPLTLLSLKKESAPAGSDGHEIAVIEMGANHVGEIAMLCNVAKPIFGIITNIGKAHLEGFGSYEGVIKAKSELYDYIRNNKGKVFVNGDDALLMKHSEGIDRVTYSTSKGAMLVGTPDTSSFLARGEIDTGFESLMIESRLAGSYNFTNIMAASLIGFCFGIKLNAIKIAIEGYAPSNNRSQIIKKGSNTIWLDAYNANPDSMKAAIEHFINDNGNAKTLILGDMFELGEASGKEHQAIADLIAGYAGWNAVYLIGKEFSKVNSSNVIKFINLDELLEQLKLKPIENNIILVKGSRGMAMEKVLEVL
jgi:UDP-N-acetylmuramoyl-tripeptide--D-alanyl-D-alanine ligase